MKTSRAILVLLLLFSGIFTLAIKLDSRVPHWTERSSNDTFLKLLFGDSRRLFANHFFVKADIAFHSGYYPTIFDQARQAEENDKDVAHPDEDAGAENGGHQEGGFLGPPTDWIDRFGRHFRVTEHTHLQGETAREILPWLRISAELDPHRVEIYAVTAYWLRERLGKVDEAEAFLREGLRANPNAPQLLYELGRLDYENKNDLARAKNLWLFALRRCHELAQPPLLVPDRLLQEQILGGLAKIAEAQGNYPEAIGYTRQLKQIAPSPEAIQKLIDALESKARAKN